MALRRCMSRILYWPCTTRHRSSSESASATCSSTVLDTYPHSRRSRLHLTSHARAGPLRSPIGRESRSSWTSCRSEINGDSLKLRLLGASAPGQSGTGKWCEWDWSPACEGSDDVFAAYRDARPVCLVGGD